MRAQEERDGAAEVGVDVVEFLEHTDGALEYGLALRRDIAREVRRRRPDVVIGLTQRERDVALAVCRGLSNAEIAAELYLSVPTVKAHVSRLFDKLQVTNRVQIAIVVHDAGLA